MSYDVPVGELKETASEEIMRALTGGDKKKLKKLIKLYKGKGCDRCAHTGYVGRVGIYEVMEMTDEIRELIMASANARDIKHAAMKVGMTTMLEDGIRKVLAGMTTLEEVIKITGGE